MQGAVALTELRDAWAHRSPGQRLADMRRAAPRLKARIQDSGTPRAVRTLDIATFPYPTRYAFSGQCTLPLPYVWMHNRALLVDYVDQDGQKRRLLINPSRPEGSRKAPYFQRLLGPVPGPLQGLAEHALTTQAPPLHNQLLTLGVSPSSIDYITFDHLHVQEVGPMLGPQGLYPRAKLLITPQELAAARAPHPMQRTWYVEGALAGVPEEALERFTGDLLLGEGIALLCTPGHTEGNHSIALALPEGLITISENGVAAECYEPEKSRIPGLAEHARRTGEEVVLNANTRERTLDQYTSMVLEKLLSQDENAPFVRHFSSSELVSSHLSPGLRPTHQWRRFEHGEVEVHGR